MTPHACFSCGVPLQDVPDGCSMAPVALRSKARDSLANDWNVDGICTAAASNLRSLADLRGISLALHRSDTFSSKLVLADRPFR